MNRIYLLVVFLLTQSTTFAQKYFHCFTCDSKPSLQLSVCYENDKIVYVKYKGQDETIPLTFVKNKNISVTAYSTDESTYTENYRGVVNGTYKFTKSGNWYYITYKRKKDGKVFKFTIDHEKSIVNEEFRTTPCY
jgi:uncharacterized membrane protein YfhO